jgi:hypothetical protein
MLVKRLDLVFFLTRCVLFLVLVRSSNVGADSISALAVSACAPDWVEIDSTPTAIEF